MISRWNAKEFNGQILELLAIDATNQAVGYVGLRGQTKKLVSRGIKTFPSFRQRGYAYEVYLAALIPAKQLDIQAATTQVRTDNEASVQLHKKVGFQIDQIWIISKGHEVRFFLF